MAIGVIIHSTIEANLMNLKGWDALGASNSQERTRALDMLGFHRQLVFPSVALSQFWGLFGQQQTDPELLYGGARALNRAMTDFCAHDKRLIPVGFVPEKGRLGLGNAPTPRCTWDVSVRCCQEV